MAMRLSRSVVLAWGLFLLLFSNPGRAAESGEDAFAWEGSWPGYRRGQAAAVAVQGLMAYCAMGEGGLVTIDLAVAGGPRVINRLTLPDACGGLLVRGDFGYLALGPSGLGIVDLSSPGSPRLLRTVPSAYVSQVVAMDGLPQLGVVNGSEFQVYDLEDPAEPRLLSSYTSLPPSQRQVVAGSGRLYLNTGSGLQVFETKEPQSLVLLGEFRFANRFTPTMALTGKYAFMSFIGMGVSVIDLSDPELPREAERLPLKSAQSIAIIGKHLWVWDGQAGMVSFNIENPAQPVEVARLDSKQTEATRPFVDQDRIWLPLRERGLLGVRLDEAGGLSLDPSVDLDSGRASDLAVQGDRVYVADGPGGLAILRWNPPGALDLLGRFRTDYAIDAVSVSGDRAAILSLGQVSFLDVRDAARVRVLGHPVAPTNGFFWQYGVVLGPEYAYLGGFGLGLCRLADLPNCPVTDIYGWGTDQRVRGLVIHEGRLFACIDQAIWIFALDDPGHPRLLGKHRAPNLGRTWNFDSIGFVGDLGLAVTDTFGLEAVDLSDLEFTRSLGNSLPWRRFGSIVPHGPWGLGPVDGVLSLLDLTNPGAVGVSSPNPDATVSGPVQVVGNRILATDGGRGVVVRRLPLAPPAFWRSPALRHVLPSGGSVTLEVEVSGTQPIDLQWLRDGYPLPGQTAASLQIDEADPHAEGRYSVRAANPAGQATSSGFEVRRESPVTFSEVLRIAGPARAIEIVDDRAYLCLGDEGLICFDVQRPTAPVELWRQRPGGGVNDVRLRGGFAYLAGGERGFTILDAESGEIVGQGEAVGSLSLEVWGDFAYVSTATTGLLTLNVADPKYPGYPSQWTGTWAPLTLARSGSQLLAAASDVGVFIFDLSSPQPLGSPVLFPLGSGANVTSSGNRAVAVDAGLIEFWPLARAFPAGLQSLDLTKPGSPRSLGRRPFSLGVQAMTLAGARLYVASTNGLTVLDVSDPASPRVLGAVSRDWQPLDVAVHRNTVWLADANEGFLILKTSGANPPRLDLIRGADDSIELRWPWGGGGLLEQAQDTLEGPWAPVPEMFLADSWQTTATRTNTFFRLSFP